MATELELLLDSWCLHLRAERKSESTIDNYRAGVRAYMRWCESTGTEADMSRRSIVAFIAGYLRDHAPGSARNRADTLGFFHAWLVEEGERTEPLGKIPKPKDDETVVPELTAEEIKALLRACKGTGFTARRDDALVRLMLETGIRASEACNLDVADIDLRDGAGLIQRGKGGRARVVPFGAQTGRAIDRYLRVRARYQKDVFPSPALWLGVRGGRLSYLSLYKALTARGQEAGLEGFHPHVLRHTMAGRWLEAGGSEGGLMNVAGWRQRSMIDRYTRHTSAKRAQDEARRLNLGDV